MKRAMLLWALASFAAGAQAPAPLPFPPGVPVGQGSDGDWAFVAKYRAVNAALPTADKPRIVFMGDSITQGWAAQPFLKDDPSHVGRGISGQTAQQMLVRFHSDVIDLKPAVVHIMAGTNDVAGNTGPETDREIQGYVSAMVELAKAHGIRVVLASIPPASAFPWKPGVAPADRIRSLNAWLRRYAAAQGATYVDYWSALAAPDGGMKAEYARDGVHPTAEGYAAMRPLAEAAFARALARR